jgi:predicted acetyltransferase
MPEIRPAREDELDRVHLVVAYSFTGDGSQEGRERMRHVEEMAMPTVLIEDCEIVASLRVYDFTMLVNGAPVRIGGVSSVACLPEYRRKGYVGMLLRHSLEKMRERGQPLSALYTPRPSLYRRYGWMLAASNLKFSFNPKHVSAYSPAAARGRAVRITEEDQPVVEQVFRRFSERRTGQHVSSARWWREAFFRRIYDPERKLADVAVWFGDNGEPSGYLCYESSRVPPPLGMSKMWLREFVALSGDACRASFGTSLSHDLPDEIFWYGPVEDPLAYAVDDSFQVKREYVEDMMLRVVDVEAACRRSTSGCSRRTGGGGVDRSQRRGSALEPGYLAHSARKADGASVDLSMEAATFAAVYDGFMKASDAVRSGLAEGTDHEAALLADRVFAPMYPPNGSDSF